MTTFYQCGGPEGAVFPEANVVAREMGRPVVVIDPEDREQVERLTRIFMHDSGDETEDMQAALREFANPTPPKPDEPTGLGAVAEDADGFRYIRTHVRDDISYSWSVVDESANKPFRMWTWADISAVRVLSEGVPS